MLYPRGSVRETQWKIHRTTIVMKATSVETMPCLLGSGRVARVPPARSCARKTRHLVNDARAERHRRDADPARRDARVGPPLFPPRRSGSGLRSATGAVVLLMMGNAVLASSKPLPEKVTFAEHVAPILFQNCSRCHRPGEAAPFSLLTYEDAKKRGRQIAEVTASRFMPPWHADSGYIEFSNERRLTEEQIAMFGAWHRQGMKLEKQQSFALHAYLPPLRLPEVFCFILQHRTEQTCGFHSGRLYIRQFKKTWLNWMPAVVNHDAVVCH